MADQPAPTQGGNPTEGAPNTIGRRGFLSWLTVGYGALYAFIAGNFAAFLRFFIPNVVYEPRADFIAGKPEDYVDGVDERWKKEHRVWVVRQGNVLYAFEARCTHLGCTPNWFAGENRFKCPCHGSKFSIEGDVQAGPAPKPLLRPTITLMADGRIQINKAIEESRPDKRDKEPFVIRLA